MLEGFATDVIAAVTVVDTAVVVDFMSETLVVG